ncbi:MAG TPA: AAA family ATPase [Solirubrobacteraceae bacterium]|jgi:DNA-binding CsgD family transcriptional regulator|nr:AAA family ATPase [Solirubrobacteraceae bacterium]
MEWLILGREGELAVLREAVGEARAGCGRIVLIEGEAGIGKTCLVDACLAELADGFQVLRTRAHELDRHRPFGAFVEPLTPRRGQAASEAVEFARLLGGEQPPGELHLVHEPGARVHVLEAILAALERMWMSGPLLLAVEDVQWADPESLTCLYHLARRVCVAPVVVLLTYRPSPHLPELKALIGSLLGLGARAVALGPLDEQTVIDLAAQVLGAAPGVTLTRQLDRAGGNPLFVTALLQALEAEGVLEVRAGRVEGLRDIVPPSLRLIILRRLAVLSAPCLEMLRLASILGSYFSPRDLCLVAGRPAPALTAPLREALEAGFLYEQDDHLAFRHDLVWEAIYEDQPRGVRRALHIAAGEALAAADAPAARVAAHLARAAEPGDARAIEWLRRAAREVALRAPAVAVGLLRRAQQLAEGLTGQQALLVELVVVLVWSGRVEEAECLASEVLASPHDRSADAALRLVLARAMTLGGRNAEAVRHVKAALADGPLPEPERSELVAWGALAVFPVDPGLAQTWAREAKDAAERAGHDPAVCIALTAMSGSALLRGDLQEAIDLAGRSAQRASSSAHEEARRWPAAGMAVSVSLIEADRLDEAELILRQRRASSEEIGSWGLASHAFCAAHARFARGEWDDARAEAQAGVVLAEEIGGRSGAVCGLAILALTALHRDELDAAADAVAAADDELERVEYQLYGHWAIWARGLLAEALGDLSGALAALEEAWSVCVGVGSLPDVARLGPDLVRLKLAAGKHDDSHTAADTVQRAAARLRTASSRGAALRCNGLAKGDPQILSEALGACRGAPRPLEHALAAEEAGAAMARAARRAEAAATLQEALEIYQRLGAIGYAARVEAQLRELGVTRGRRGSRDRPRTGWESLTSTELRVVALVARGLTNAEVARRLFVSRHTVESHLSHVFSKLGLASRVQLAVQAAGRELPAS